MRTSFSTVAAVALADFRERVRRPGFLVVTALVLWACFALVPPPATGNSPLLLGSFRGEYTGAWMGLMFAMVVTLILPLPGFYLVRGSINRDRDTGVGSILAATPLSRWSYVAGKAASHVCVLGALLAVVSAGAVLMLVLRRETPELDLVQLLAPIWLMTLPVMVLVAGLAVLFETVRALRRGFGNVVWFFLWSLGITAGVMLQIDEGGRMVPGADVFGMSRVVRVAQDRVAAVDPSYGYGFRVGYTKADERAEIRALPWPAHPWSIRDAAERAAWLLPGLLLVAIAARFHDRFDPSRARIPLRRPSRSSRSAAESTPSSATPAPATLPAARRGRGSLLPLVRAELALLLRGRSWWWWAGAAGLLVASLQGSLATAHAQLLPLLWVWPVLLWSSLGSTDLEHGVFPLLATAPSAARRLTGAAWLAGTSLALVLGSGILLRQLAAGDLAASLALLGGAAFVPALALALGNLTGGSRTFEATYLVWWYLATQEVNLVDFMGRAPDSLTRQLLWPYPALASALLMVAVLARRHRRS